MSRAMAFAIALLICNPAYSFTKEELESMSQEELKALNVFEVMPVLFSEKKDQAVGTSMVVLLTKFAMAKLAYDVDLLKTDPPEKDPSFGHQIQLFEKQAALVPDGVLTMEEWSLMLAVSEKVGESPIYFSDPAEVYDGGDWLNVAGTWIIEGDQIAWPINRSEIICQKSSSNCEVNNISITVSKITESGNTHYVNVSKENYKIVSWSPNSVIAVSSGDCRTATLTVNISSNEVFETTSNVNKEGCDVLGLGTLPALEKPRISRLMPSWDITYNFWQARMKEILRYQSPEFRAVTQRLEALSK
jgi:hypothetical protein